LLARPPRPVEEPIFNRLMIKETLLSGAWMGLVAYAFFAWALASGWSEFDSRNVLLFLMVLFENVHVFNCRSETRSAFRVPLSANWPVVATVACAQGLHIAAGYMPGLSEVLEMEPIPVGLWLTLLPIALSLLLVMELFKAMVRKHSGRVSAQSDATETTR
jgi:magnesium-transporting ATPase (P-type)